MPTLMEALVNQQRGPLSYGIPKPVVQPGAPTAPPPSVTPPPNMGGAPLYGDIWQYLDPNTEGAKNSWAKGTQNQTITGYAQDKEGNSTPTYGMDYNLSGIPDKYKGLVAGLYSTGGPGVQANYDFSKIGGGHTVFGNDKNSTIDQMYSLGSDPNKPPTLYMKAEGGRAQDDTAVKDRSQVKWDPRFGWITPKMNLIHPVQEKLSGVDIAGMALGAAMGGGLFGAVSPAMGLGMAGMNALHGLGDGQNWKQMLMNIAPSLIGMGIGGMGGLSGFKLPPEIATALQYAKYGKGAYDIANLMKKG